MIKEVFSQEEFDTIPDDFEGRILIKFGTPRNRAVVNRSFKSASVVAMENSSVVAYGNSSVVAMENSSVVAYGNSSVVAWENSSVVAMENSSVAAWENSSVVAYGNSSVVAYGNSSVVAMENSSVVAMENSSVVAYGNSQVCKKSSRTKITANGNARIVSLPHNVEEYSEFYDVPIDAGKIRLYKAVHHIDNSYFSDFDSDFEYPIGEEVTAIGFADNENIECGEGLHAAHKCYAVNYGHDWEDLAILELEFDVKDIVVPLYSYGKVRGRKAKVIREVPLSECGLIGEILERRKKNAENAV